MKQKKKNKNFKLRINQVILIVIIIVLVLAIIGILTSKKENTTFTSKSELIEILDLSELSAAEYIYNGIAKKMTPENKVAYYVSYKGTIKAGVNIANINYEEDRENKRIIVTLPEVEIFDSIVDASDLDFIFVDRKYDTETVHQEAYNLSKEALNSSIENDNAFYQKTRENVVSIIRATIEPLIDAKDNEYQLEIN